MPIYSHSRLASFENCPRQYFYRYIARVEVEFPTTIEAFMGSRVHDALEDLYRFRRDGRVLTADELLARYRADWDAAHTDDIPIVRDELTAEDYRRVGEECLVLYHARHHSFDASRTVWLEGRVIVDLDGTGQYKLQGYIDRLARRADGTWEIHDYKTSSQLPTQVDQDEDRQLALYQIGIEQKWDDVDSVELVWHFLRFDTEIRSRRTPEQLDGLRQAVIGVIDDIESRDGEDAFPTNESRLCDWCSYQQVCPARKHLVQVRGMEPAEVAVESGVQLVDRYASLDAEIRGLKQRINALTGEQDALASTLIAHAAAEGLEVIAGQDHEVLISRTQQFRLPTKSGDPDGYAAMEQVLRASPEWPAVSSPDLAGLKRILQGRANDPGGVRGLLEPFAEEEEVVKPKLRPRTGETDSEG